MKKYEFVNLSSFRKKMNYSIAAVGSLTLLLGVTGSLVVCNAAIITGGAIAYKVMTSGEFAINKFIKDNLHQLIKHQEFYKEKDQELIYKPDIYYHFDEKFLYIAVKLDGSKFRENYLGLIVIH